MSDAQADKPAEKKKDGGKKKSGGSPLAGLRGWFSAPGCAALLTGCFLLLLVIAVWIWFWLDPANVPWRHAMSWPRILLQVLLVIAIPLVLYQAIRLWLEGDPSPYPDIDFAWRSGLDALAESGLSLTGAPLFLVLGSSGVGQEQALVHAARLALRVRDVPEGPAPLHWYAGPDGIYLVLSDACGASMLAALIEKRRGRVGGFDETRTPAELPALHRAAAGASSPSAQPALKRDRPSPTGDRTRGTIMLDQFVADRAAEEAQALQASATATEEVAEPEPMTMRAVASDQPAILSQQESTRQRERLEYVCHLIRGARAPLCPINGVLVLLPFELLQGTQRETQQLQKTVRQDLGCLQRALAVRCPLTALIVGMQGERGFRELVRRVGRERAEAQRFGRRFDLRIVPSPESLTALCTLVVGVFEDWIHTLFREADALARPGNLRLYSLLCKVRTTLSGVLSEVMVSGFAHEPGSRELPEPIPFSGCYFAATGESDDQQAFVRGVFEKLVEEQEEVEWTRSAVATNRRFQAIAATSAALTACLIVGWVVVAIVSVVN